MAWRILTNEVTNVGEEQNSKDIVDDLVLFCFSKRGSWCILVIMILKGYTFLELTIKRIGYFITVGGKKQSLGTTVKSLRYTLAFRIVRKLFLIQNTSSSQTIWGG